MEYNQIMNISPYKIIEHNGKEYVFDINNMSVYKVDRNTIKIFEEDGKYYEEIYNKVSHIFSKEKFEEIISQMEEIDFIKSPRENEVINNYTTPPLKGLTLLIAQGCNLSCSYCFGDEGKYYDNGIMSEKIAIDAINYLLKNSANEKKLYITFFGGEPLICFDTIKKIIKFCELQEKESGKQFFYSMTTNGTLINDEIEEIIKRNNISTLISIDGNESQHNYNRYFYNREGSYEIVLEKTKNLREKNLLSARATITKTNIDLKSVFEHLESLNFRSIPMAPANNLMSDLEFHEFTNKSLELIDYFEELIKNKKYKEASKLKNIWQSIQKIHFGAKQKISCGAGLSGLAVDIHGNLFPCHRFVANKEFSLGNIYSEQSRRNEYLGLVHLDNNNNCCDCWIKNLCVGGCPNDNYIDSGSVNKSSIRNCNFNRLFYERLLHLYLDLTEEEKQIIFSKEERSENEYIGS